MNWRISLLEMDRLVSFGQEKHQQPLPRASYDSLHAVYHLQVALDCESSVGRDGDGAFGMLRVRLLCKTSFPVRDRMDNNVPRLYI